MKEQPNYYAIIPANVRYDENLIQGAKLLYGEITALTHKEGYCWANDTYFANLYQISKKTVQRWLSSLEKEGYITRTVKYKEGSNEIDSRYIHLCHYPIDKNDSTPMDKKVRDNNTSINNTINKRYMCDSEESHDSNKSNLSLLRDNFETIWKLYPAKRRRDKEKCFTRYKNAIEDGEKHEDIYTGVKNYVQYCNDTNTKNEFIRITSTFFNNRNWNDFIDYKAETVEKRDYSSWG